MVMVEAYLNYFDEKTIEALKPFHSILEGYARKEFFDIG